VRLAERHDDEVQHPRSDPPTKSSGYAVSKIRRTTSITAIRLHKSRKMGPEQITTKPADVEAAKNSPTLTKPRTIVTARQLFITHFWIVCITAYVLDTVTILLYHATRTLNVRNHT